MNKEDELNDFNHAFAGEEFDDFTVTDDYRDLGVSKAVFMTTSKNLWLTFDDKDASEQTLEFDHKKGPGTVEVYKGYGSKDTWLRHGITHVAVEFDTSEKKAKKHYIASSEKKSIAIF